MRILLFYHSLISDWNHGNAHFLRGITTELLKRGHDVQVFEPLNGWSFRNWLKENGMEGFKEFNRAFPYLTTNFYEEPSEITGDLKNADLVIVHEWNDPDLVKFLGDNKQYNNYRLLFHDTHHRSATSPKEIGEYDLSAYDGVLAFGNIVKELYLKNQWADRAWTWHEAADTSHFKPMKPSGPEGDLVWIGNWGDNERTEELMEFLIEPVKKLGLSATMYGVRYPEKALQLLDKYGINYGGYLPSYRAPEVYSKYRLTVHIPRKAYASALPGIPTIRPFEALACGIPLISAPWRDTEQLFRQDKDFIMVQNGLEMTEAIENTLNDAGKRTSMIRCGLETIREYHTCSHRVEELLGIYRRLTTESNVHANIKP